MMPTFGSFYPLILTVLAVGAQFSASAQAEPNPAPWTGTTLTGEKCHSGQNTANPGDYLRPDVYGQFISMVEEHHFSEDTEALIQGVSGTVEADIHFTLQAIPNHHRALQSSVNDSLKYEQWPKDFKGLPAECYLQRAIVFQPNDAFVFKLFGFYLHKKGRPTEALAINQRAMQLAPKDAMLRYNTALIYVELQQYQKAAQLAKPLYDAGLPLTGLKTKLIAAGAWQDSSQASDNAAADDDDTLPAQPAEDPNGPVVDDTGMSPEPDIEETDQATAAGPDADITVE